MVLFKKHKAVLPKVGQQNMMDFMKAIKSSQIYNTTSNVFVNIMPTNNRVHSCTQQHCMLLLAAIHENKIQKLLHGYTVLDVISLLNLL